jgi:hypothetical protein
VEIEDPIEAETTEIMGSESMMTGDPEGTSGTDLRAVSTATKRVTSLGTALNVIYL